MQDNIQKLKDFINGNSKLKKRIKFYNPSSGERIGVVIGNQPFRLSPGNLFTIFNNANNDTERDEVIVEWLNNSFLPLFKNSYPENGEKLCEALDALNESVFGDKGKDGFSKEIIYRQQLKKKIRETRSQIKEDQKVINKKLRRNKKFKDVREQSEIFDKRTKQVIKVAESSLKEFITKANAATQEEKDIYAVLVEQRIQLEKQLFLSLEDNNEKEKKKK